MGFTNPWGLLPACSCPTLRLTPEFLGKLQRYLDFFLLGIDRCLVCRLYLIPAQLYRLVE